MNSTCHAFQWPITMRGATATSGIRPIIMRGYLCKVQYEFIYRGISLHTSFTQCRATRFIDVHMRWELAQDLYDVSAIIWKY